MSGEPRAFFAVDVGAATTSAALVGRIEGCWRLVGAAAFPAGVEVDAILDALTRRFLAGDPQLAAQLAGGPGRDRLAARSTPPRPLVVVAASARGLPGLERAASRAGWRVRSASADAMDPLAMTGLMLEADVGGLLVGADDPPSADERGGLGQLAALAAGVSARRPELPVVLAGAVAEHAGLFTVDGERPPGVVLGPAASAGEPRGASLRSLLEACRGGAHESRTAFARGVGALAEALDRRVEGIELGLDGAARVRATPGVGAEPAAIESAVVATAGLFPPEPDDEIVDAVLAWSTTRFDRWRMRDRLRDLRLSPWGDIAGDGAPLRLAAARAALARLVAATPEMNDEAAPDLLVVAGGAWAVAPGPAVALAVADVVRRPGATQIAWDHARMLAPLGTVDDATERRRLAADLAGDLLAPLGSVVMPQGMRAGRAGGRLVVHGPTGLSELDLIPGGLELVDLPPGQSAVAEFQFRHPIRLGTRGRHFAVDVAGGLGGLLVDLRDVPLRLPDRADRRRELLAAWQAALWAGLER